MSSELLAHDGPGVGGKRKAGRAESGDAIQINEESFAQALAHHSRGAAAGPSGWTHFWL